MAVIVVALFALATAARVLAEGALANRPGSWWGPLQLRLAYNPGISFSFGSTLPAWLITAATAAVTLAVTAYAWHVAPTTSRTGRVGLACVVTGALANLTDRATDGVVTDYLHTGWFPTFNLPDIYITLGALLLLTATLRSKSVEGGDR